MEPRGAVALDDEAAAADGARGAGLGGRRRFRGLREVALAAVFLEGHALECATASGRLASTLRPMAANVPHPRDLLDLTGKVAVVTGASQGIGAGIATRFAAAGAGVVVHYRRGREAADELVAGIEQAGGTAVALGAELDDEARVARLFHASAATARPGRHPGQQRRPELPAPPAAGDLAGRVAGDVPRQPRVDVPVHPRGRGRDARTRRRGDRQHRLDLGDESRPATTATTTARRPRCSPSPGRPLRSSGRSGSG